MQRYIIGRALQGLVCLFLMSVIVFFGARLTGDPLSLMLSQDATQADRVAMADYLGLNDPLPVQYWRFISNAARGDLGNSLYFKRPVTEVILERLPASLELGVTAILFSLLLALPLGVYAAVRRGSIVDLAVRVFAVLGQSVPAFWLGLVLIFIFAVGLGVVPAGGRAGPASIIMPAFVLSQAVMSGIVRLLRSSMLEVLDSEYVKLARIKGVPERLVIWKHAFKNALLPVVTFAVMTFVTMLAGAVVVETVFSWPGVGRLVVQSVTWMDFPTVQGVVLLFTLLFISGNFFVDILYAYLNPKIRY